MTERAIQIEHLSFTEAILRKLEILAWFLIGEYNFNNIKYADDTLFIADTKGKFEDKLDEVVKERGKKETSIVRENWI